MAIASHLLKRMAIVTLCKVPWEKAIVSRRSNNKPYFANTQPDGPEYSINFNVSHQAGIVTLVAIASSSIDIGTDVVCVNERGNVDKKSDFYDWVSMHADVFHPNEMEYLQRNPQNLNLDIPQALSMPVSECKHRGQILRAGDCEIASDSVVDAKVRRFFAAWCLREAFIKMQGEALLAKWLKELEFRNVRAPEPQVDASPSDVETQGEVITGYEVFLRGEAYPDVLIELRALGQNYMVGTVIHPNSAGGSYPRSLPGFRHIGEDDIYAAASKY